MGEWPDENYGEGDQKLRLGMRPNEGPNVWTLGRGRWTEQGAEDANEQTTLPYD